MTGDGSLRERSDSLLSKCALVHAQMGAQLLNFRHLAMTSVGSRAQLGALE